MQDEDTIDDPMPPQRSLSDDWKEYDEKTEQESDRALDSRKASVFTNIKREMTLYESSGNRGQILDQIYTALLSIPPTSVEESSHKK